MSHGAQIDFLKNMGITESEARVYLLLLKEGSMKAGSISKRVGIHRRSVYDAIDRLRQKGMVSYIKTNNVNYYEAAEPKRLLTILKEREKDIQSILPELEGLNSLTQEKKETLFFRGKASLKTVFNDQLEVVEQGEEILVIGTDLDLTDVLKYYFPKFDAERIKKNIKVRLLMDETAKNIKTLKKIPLCTIKFAHFSSKALVSTYIYANRVSIVRWGPEPIAVVIKENEIADRYRDYFELLWNGGK